MGERTGAAGRRAARPGEAVSLRAAVAPYVAVLRSRWLAQTTYRSSLTLDVLASAAVGVVELAEILVIFTNVTVLGGLRLADAALLYAMAQIAFSLADLVVGHMDTLPHYLRTGTLDAFLLRPLSVLGQLATAELTLRRLGRTAVGVLALLVAAPYSGVDWHPATVAFLVVAVLSGAAVFAALFVCASALQFYLVEGAEMVNAVTYGSSYAAQFPASIFTTPVRVLFTFVVPAAFVAYLPLLVLLGMPGPAGLPSWLGYLTPLAAVWSWGAALLLWRAGLRHYTGTGS